MLSVITVPVWKATEILVILSWNLSSVSYVNLTGWVPYIVVLFIRHSLQDKSPYLVALLPRPNLPVFVCFFWNLSLYVPSLAQTMVWLTLLQDHPLPGSVCHAQPAPTVSQIPLEEWILHHVSLDTGLPLRYCPIAHWLVVWLYWALHLRLFLFPLSTLSINLVALNIRVAIWICKKVHNFLLNNLSDFYINFI